MAKVTGIGGVFFKSTKDSAALAAWYQKHLGMPLEESHENGKFAWIMNPEGNKVELWEPMAWEEKNKQ